MSNGLFTVLLDFGPGEFTGPPRWLQIYAATNSVAPAYLPLTPRQLLTPAPYAIFANTASNLSGTLPTAQLSGTVNNGQLTYSGITVSAGRRHERRRHGDAGRHGDPDQHRRPLGDGQLRTSRPPRQWRVILGDTATSASTANTLVKRDSNGNFAAGSVTLNGSLNLPATTTSGAGVINLGGTPFLHGFGTANFFGGLGAGNMVMGGTLNTGVGAGAMANNTGGTLNTGVGAGALASNQFGSDNTASGYLALNANTSGNFNTADGMDALKTNTTGIYNTANGYQALYNNNGNNNTANGVQALYNNTADGNMADGYQALYANTSGYQNTANGYQALYANVNGTRNTANGYQALYGNMSGSNNVAFGIAALSNNTNGNNNIAVGYAAGTVLPTGNANIYIGNLGGSTGNYGGSPENNTIRIGDLNSGNYNYATRAFVAGISGVPVSGVAVYVDGNGQLGTILPTGENTALGFQALYNNTSSGLDNTAVGYLALYSNTNGYYNTASGVQALYANKNGFHNTADGASALVINKSGCDNTASGFSALYGNTSGNFNTADGSQALYFNSTGSNNTANGYQALYNNNADGNVANGYQALYANTSGACNVAIGYQALYSNLGGRLEDGSFSGSYNTAIGFNALLYNTTGDFNTADGFEALANNNADGNTAIGYQALQVNTGGGYNTAVGYQALKNYNVANTNGGSDYSANTAIGYQALNSIAQGYENIAVGIGAGSSFGGSESQNIDIGNIGVAGESRIIRIGDPTIQTATYLAGNVYATSNVYAHGIQLTSDRNAKENFTAVNAREVLAKLAALPVTQWNYKTDSKEVQHVGPMAQDFQAAFGLDGTDDKHISVVDEGGVALAAIQGLNQKLNEKEAEIQALKQQLAATRQEMAGRLSLLEKAIARVADKPETTLAAH